MFYDFIINKARGKSGPLFSFDVHEDVRMISDASVEKDEVSWLLIFLYEPAMPARWRTAPVHDLISLLPRARCSSSWARTAPVHTG